MHNFTKIINFEVNFCTNPGIRPSSLIMYCIATLFIYHLSAFIPYVLVSGTEVSLSYTMIRGINPIGVDPIHNIDNSNEIIIRVNALKVYW